MSKTLQDLIASKQKELKAKANRVRPIKLSAGKHIIRVLPSWRGAGQAFWHDFGQHFIKDDSGEMASVYLCLDKTFGKQCPVCDAIKTASKAARNDQQIALLEQAKSGGAQYLINVLHRNDREKANEPQVLQVGATVFEAILALFDDYGDVTDINTGYDLVIERTGTGRKDTRYSVRPLPKEKCKPVAKEVLDRLVNLDDYVAQESDPELNKALTAVGACVGLLPKPAHDAPTLSAGRSAPALAAAETVDADFEDVSAAKTASASSGDDDLDSLLADIDD
jgi:hypothetical protein